MRWGAVLVAGAVLALSACDSTDCKTYAAYGLNVVVLDASGDPVCDATVTAEDGRHSEVLPPGYGSDCSYHGAMERKGKYSITAVAPHGATGSARSVRVSADECHVHPASVTITLGA